MVIGDFSRKVLFKVILKGLLRGLGEVWRKVLAPLFRRFYLLTLSA
jgi:hypothetical protein